MTELLHCKIYDSTQGDLDLHGDEGQSAFLQIKIYQKFQKKVLISFEDLNEKSNFAQFQGCGSKTEPATPLSILNFEWVWQNQFLSYTQKTLEKYPFYIDEQMQFCHFFILPTKNEKIFSLNSRPITVDFEGFSMVSGLEQREKNRFFYIC